MIDLFNSNQIVEENIDEAREILQENILLSEYLAKKGYYVSSGKGKIPCPNPEHDDGSPSFFYDDDTGECNCFGCSLGGTIVELNLAIERARDGNYSSVRSIEDLAKEYKIRIPNLRKRNPKNKVIKKRTRKDVGKKVNNNLYLKELSEKSRIITKALHNKDITVDEALEYYKIIDDVWLENSEAKTAILQLRGK